MLREGFTYSSINASIAVKVMIIHRCGKRKTNATIKVFNKLNGLVYDIKNYNLINANILHWYIDNSLKADF